MFTGIVEERGEVVTLDLASDGTDARVVVRGPKVTSDAGHGDSISVSGVCLTVVGTADGTFTADDGTVRVGAPPAPPTPPVVPAETPPVEPPVVIPGGGGYDPGEWDFRYNPYTF